MPAITEFTVEVDDRHHFDLLESQINMFSDKNKLYEELKNGTY